MKVTGQNALIGKVSGEDLLHYTLSMPEVAVANVGMDGYATLESCVETARLPTLPMDQRRFIQTQLAADTSKSNLAYLEPGYVDGSWMV